MTIHPLTMPKIGLTMEEGTVAKRQIAWLAESGLG